MRRRKRLKRTATKRKRKILKQDMDDTMAKRKRPVIRFDDLPTDILTGIISRLPVKDAARTSILSSHWQKIWCSHASLDFNFYSMLSRSYIKRDWTSHGASLNKKLFIQRVSQVFEQHSGLPIEQIAIKFELENEDAYHIDRWLNFAIATNAKDLTLDFKSKPPSRAQYDFPFKLFGATDSPQLQSIRLCSVCLKPPVDFKAFLNLKRLKLEEIDVTNEDMQILISNCNTLEFLGIVGCGMLTRLSTLHPSNRLKHLQVESCQLLEQIKLNFGLTKLEYMGPLIPLAPPGPLLLTNVCMKLRRARSSLEYIFTNLPSTLPRLETLTVQCSELERATLPDKLIKFMHLKHLRLQLRHPVPERFIDLLDFVCLLEAAPLLEKFELHMWMPLDHERYSEEAHGALRSLPPQPHAHLRLVHISGFNGMKDQVELALHILRNSAMLKAMKIDPKPLVALPCISMLGSSEKFQYLDGYEVAMEYLSKEDDRNVVDVSEVRREEVETLSVYELVDPGCVVRKGSVRPCFLTGRL